MKKILVLSDSHSYFDEALKIFEKEKPDIVIGAGDGIKDIDDLSYVHPEAKYYMVKGNCDYFDRNHNEENLFEIDGVRSMKLYMNFFSDGGTHAEKKL